MSESGRWFFDRMAEYEGRPALLFRDETWSYRGLLAAVERWRADLDRQGVESGGSVAIAGPVSPSSCALLLALIASGRVAVPVGPLLGRRTDLFDVAGVSAVCELTADGEGSFERRPVPSPPDLLARLRREGRPGLVLFTSGSTGEPRAVLHDCERLLDGFRAARAARRSILFLALDHIGGFNTFLSLLTAGGTAVLLEERGPQAVCGAIERHRAELLPTTPTFLRMLLVSRAYLEHDLASLRLITYGAEPMPESTLSRLREVLPEVRLLQTYGLSELGIPRTRSRASDSLWVQVGGPGCETRVVDGVLFLRAATSMVGYLNAPSPFDPEGWFNTGDEVSVDGDFLRIHGRRSEIINVGGEKLHPAEVESILLEMDNVREAVVWGKASPVTGQLVAATLRLFAPEPVADLGRRVRAFCRGRLASYKIPLLVEISDDAVHGDRFKKLR
jgi:long-chain acyl-CoA synthetase